MSMMKMLSGGVRAAQITAAMIPALRAGDDDDGDKGARARRHLASVLGRFRGLPTKLGQWMAGGEHGDDFAGCTSDLPPIAWPTIRSALTQAWGKPVESAVARIEESGHAASLGQVHRAWLHDGREVAIKVQYPGIRDEVDIALLALSLVPELGPVRRHGMDLEHHRKMLRETLERELDYGIEAATQQRAHKLAGPEVIVPRIHSELSRGTILVQDWEDGITIENAIGWPQADRDAAGAALVRRFVRQIMHEGLVHGDPHPGNFRFRRTASKITIVQYDHGCMIEISAQQSTAMRNLVFGARTGTGDPLALLASTGFAADKLTPIAARLPQVMRILLQPLVVPGPCIAADWHPAQAISAELGADRWWFRAAGNPDHFLVTRAFGGLVRQLQRLSSTVDWAECWAEALDERLPLAGCATQQPCLTFRPISA